MYTSIYRFAFLKYMKSEKDSLHVLLGDVPAEIRIRTALSMDIASRIERLMREKGLTKKQFAETLGRRPSEITKWLSGEHNFTVATLARLSAFFGKPVISVVKE